MESGCAPFLRSNGFASRSSVSPLYIAISEFGWVIGSCRAENDHSSYKNFQGQSVFVAVATYVC